MPKQSWSQHNKSLHVCSLIFSKLLKLVGILHRIMTLIFRHLNCVNPHPTPGSLHPLPAAWATCALAETLTIGSIYLFTPPASHRLEGRLRIVHDTINSSSNSHFSLALQKFPNNNTKKTNKQAKLLFSISWTLLGTDPNSWTIPPKCLLSIPVTLRVF